MRSLLTTLLVAVASCVPAPGASTRPAPALLERPPLAAIAVADQGALSAVQQIHALGHPGDLLVCLALGSQSRATRTVIEAGRLLPLGSTQSAWLPSWNRW